MKKREKLKRTVEMDPPKKMRGDFNNLSQLTKTLMDFRSGKYINQTCELPTIYNYLDPGEIPTFHLYLVYTVIDSVFEGYLPTWIEDDCIEMYAFNGASSM